LTALTKKNFWPRTDEHGQNHGNHAARGIGWFYMVTTCVIQLSIGCY